MPAASLLKYLHLSWASRPKAQRRLYRAIRRHRLCRIVELGTGDARRAMRMIAVAQRYSGELAISYTGIDLFEARPAGMPGLKLKQAHQRLVATGARVRLVPGDPFTALAHAANNLTGTDLLLVAHDQDAESLARAWFYVPRVLAPAAHVLIERVADTGQASWEPLSRAQIEQWAKAGRVRRAA